MTLLLLCLSMTVGAQEAMPRNFHVEISYMYPLRYNSRQVMDFSLDVKGDTATVCLPYMGEVYMPSINREGLNFRGKMVNLKRERDRKGVERLTWLMKRDEVSYEFTIQAYPGHEVELRLRPSNAQPCSYMGDWQPLESEEK